jgi:hypothetical protein
MGEINRLDKILRSKKKAALTDPSSQLKPIEDGLLLSWKCSHFRCRPQLVLTTCLRVFPTRRPDTAGGGGSASSRGRRQLGGGEAVAAAR